MISLIAAESANRSPDRPDGQVRGPGVELSGQQTVQCCCGGGEIDLAGQHPCPGTTWAFMKPHTACPFGHAASACAPWSRRSHRRPRGSRVIPLPGCRFLGLTQLTGRCWG